jgi:hypothetical protein
MLEKVDGMLGMVVGWVLNVDENVGGVLMEC